MSQDRRLEMAVQFQSYLLASSPPGFELLSSNWLERRMFGREFANNSKPSSQSDDSSSTSAQFPKEYEFRDARLVAARDKELDKKRIQEWESSYDCNLEACGGHCFSQKVFEPKFSKKVLFADDFGQKLSEVRVASGPTDVPPMLNPETIKKIEETIPGFILDQESSGDSLGHHNTFNLVLINFKEPHFDLLDLHNRVERLGLTLSSLSARQNKMLGGTIEIKKKSTNKSFVYLRYTADQWKTYKDEEAQFVSLVGGTDHELYSFEFAVPSTGPSTEIEFAICHRCNEEHWDNNESLNYKISCTDDHDMSYLFGGSDDGSHIHRTMSAPSELTMWGVHDFDDAVQPYW